jgi:hypothetical protein
MLGKIEDLLKLLIYWKYYIAKMLRGLGLMKKEIQNFE